MICAQCGAKAPTSAPGTAPGRCEKCRFPLGRKECPDCTAGLFGSERYCPACGSCFAGVAVLAKNKHMKVLERYLPDKVLERLLASESGILSERKYATVLFADVSGFTSMSEEMTAEALAETMNGVFEGLVRAVHRYDGTLDKFIGDAVMAVFGAPVAHDNDPERAVYAALEMMSFVREHSEKAGRKLSLAIGVNAGQLLAGSMGGDGRLNFTVMGDTVNTAQRLMSAAGADRILVSKEIYQRVKGAVRFKTLPPIRVKGKRNPIDIWEARERRPRGELQGRGHGFVGRKAELEQLAAALPGREPRIVALVGEAGVGRTALVQQLEQKAAEQGAQGVRSTCPPYASEASAGPLTETVARLLKIRIEQGAGAIKDGKAKLVEMGLSEQEASLLLAGASREKVDTASLDYQATLKATCAAYLRVLTAAAAGGRLVVVFEDLHAASSTVRAQLKTLLASALPAGVLLVLTLRPDAEPLIEGARGMARIALEPLGNEDARALLADRLSLAVLDDSVADKAHLLTHGNPRMIEELIQSLIDQGVVFRSRQRWIVSPKLAEVAIPPGIEGLVAARIDELDADARRFVQAAAVVGTRFDPDVVRRVAGLQIDLEWVVSQLIDRRIVVADEGHGALLRFIHETYRAVAADGLPTKEKQLLHTRLGQYLVDTSDLRDPRALQSAAYHLGQGADHEKAATFLLRAAKRLVEVHQVDSAIEILERLIAVTAPAGYANYELSRCENELDEGLYHLGMLLLRKGMVEQADDKLQWAYGRSRHFFNGDFRVWALLGLAQLALARGRADEVRKFLEMAAVDSEGMRDPGLQAISLLERARLFNAEGAAEPALEAATRALELEQKIPPELRDNLPQRISQALVLLERGHAYHKAGNAFEAVSAFQEAHKSAEEAQDPFARGQAAMAMAKLAASQQDFTRAQELTADALRCFRTVGDRIAEGRSMHNYAVIELARGDHARAQKALAQAEKIFSEIDHREGLALVAEVRATLGVHRPQPPVG